MLQPKLLAAAKVLSRDCSTQSDEASQEPEATAEHGKLKMCEASSAATPGGFFEVLKAQSAPHSSF